MDNKGLILGLAIFSLSVVCVAVPMDMTLYAGSDAVVKSADPDGNYGTGEHLEWAVTAESPYEGVKSYFRFRLPEGAAGNITSATLRFTRSSVGPWNTYPRLYVLNDDASGQDWAESDIAWNNAPANVTAGYGFNTNEASLITQGTLNGSNAGGATGQMWIVDSGIVDVLNEDSDQWVTFMVEWAGAPYAVPENFAAREHATLEGPVLEITYETAEIKGVKTLASERWHAWRKKRDDFPVLAWSYFSRYSGSEQEYQIYKDAGLSVVQAPYDQSFAAMNVGLDTFLGSWENLWNDPAKLTHYLTYPTVGSQQVVGYLLYDEPDPDRFDELAYATEQIYRLDERDAIPWIDMLPNWAVGYDRFGLGDGDGSYYETYINKYVEDVSPCVLVNSHYPILDDGTDRPEYYSNIEYFRELSLTNNIGLMGAALVTGHHNYREPSESDLNWMVYSYLAYGAKGLFYYNYRIEPDAVFGEGLVNHADGTPRPTYYMAQAVNVELNNLWPVLKHLKSTAVFHTGSAVPSNTTQYAEGASTAVASFGTDNFIIGDFINMDDAEDANQYVMLVNKNHGMGIDSTSLVTTAVFTAHSACPYVSMIDPSTGGEIHLESDRGTYHLSIGGGKGALLKFTSQRPSAVAVALAPDADADIRSADLADIGYNRDTLLVGNTKPDPSAGRSYKAYVRFKLPEDFGTASSAIFSVTRTFVGAYDAPYSVSLLNDGVPGEPDWVEANTTGMSWNNAPGNVTNSPSAFTNAAVVGTFTTLKAANGGVAGDSWMISGTNLVNALNEDSNGYVTLMIGRTGQSSSFDQFASKENASYDAPELVLEYTPSITLTPDADADIRSADLANIGYDRETLLVGNTNPDPSAGRSYKTYVRFKLPEDLGTASSATFSVTRTLVGAYGAPYSVSLLNDGVPGETDWVEANTTGMNWNNAPGNVTTSPSAFTNAAVVGTFTTLKAANGGVAGDSWSISGTNLVNALNADSNGYVTLMIGRTGQSSSSDQFASKENATYAAPMLTLEYIAVSPYDNWIGRYPGVGVATNMTDNPDNDSLNNLNEWALGGNPTNAGDVGYVPVFRISDAGGSNSLEYVYARRRNAASLGLIYSLEQNTNLVSGVWTNDNYEVVGTGVLNDDFETVTNRVSTDTQGSQFLRLIIESE